ncbi:MAG: signal peptide peptidase SppA [Bacteroidetes bacterium 4572_128]|nr:MAG: signal peptide peptidase SppA [Bacteroidetes bacterium 4572_128]
MKNFFKYTLATILGVIISSFFVIIIFVATIAAFVSTSVSEIQDESPKELESHTILEIKLNEPIMDRASNNPMDNFNFQSFETNKKLDLSKILKNLKKAKDDENIDGIYLNLSSISTGIASLEEIRNALIDFKKSNKFIVSYADYYTQGTYYLASISDKIFLNPQGGLDFRGLSAEIMFYKSALEKVGIEPQIIRHGKFKSAVEPFMLDKMSESNRKQTSVFLKSIWDRMVKGISEERKISVIDLNSYADKMSLKNAQASVDLKMVDALKFKDEIISELKRLSEKKENEDLEFVSLSSYTAVPKKKSGDGLIKEKIAVIFAQGEIQMGKGSEDVIGSERISKAIREARLDSSIKAIVLRVNSPGGSALASEIILREVILAKEVKPVIASMGNYAASGGYYIACAADTIVASPTTITGSIGVFGLMFQGKKFLNDIGITVDNVKTNEHSDIGSMFRPMSTSERAVIQESVEEIYDVFISHVAKGRGMEKNAVDNIGQGRVWTGANAKDIGLVDVLGGLDVAINIAQEKAHLKKYRIISLPKQKNPFENIFSEFSTKLQNEIMEYNLGENYKYYNRLQKIKTMKGTQARMPYHIDIY